MNSIFNDRMEDNHLFQMDYHALFEEMDNGFALHKMIFDENDVAVDYQFVKVNAAFERITGLKASQIINKTACEILPNLEYLWIYKYGEVVKTGVPITFENFSQDLNRFYEVRAISPYKGYFAVIFNDITKYKIQEQKLEEQNNSLVQSNFEYSTLSEEYSAQNEELRATLEELQNLNNQLKEKEVELTQSLQQMKAVQFDLQEEIKKRTEYEAQLLEEKYLMDTLMENSSEYIYFKDLDSKFIKCSRSLSNTFGYESHEVIGKTDFDLFDEEHAIPAYGIEQKIIKTLKPVINLIEKEVRKDGSVSWITTTKLPLINKKGDVIGTFGISRDINQELTAKQKIVESEQQLNAIFDNSPVVLLLLNESTEIVKINKKGQLLSGKLTKEIQGNQGGNVFGCIESISDPRGCGFGSNCRECIIRNTIKETFLHGTDREKVEFKWDLNVSNELRTGYFYLYTTLLIINKQKYVLASIEDITKQRAYEKEIEIKNESLAKQNEELKIAKEHAEESEKLKSAFLANISHEIRTPMNGIIGFSEILVNSDLTNEKRMKFGEIIHQCCDQLLVVVNDILDISKLESGEFQLKIENVCINELLNDLYLLYKEKIVVKKIEFTLHCALNNSMSYLFTDKIRLRQILINLLNNAIKFTTAGSIKIGYEIINNTELRFFVSDTGIGIDKQHHNIIFERFRQAEADIATKFGGTGLGLSITKKLTELMGGKIELKSTINVGTTFFVTFPFVKSKSFSVPEIIPYNSNFEYCAGKTILIAEDEYVNFIYFEEVFNQVDVCLLYASNGSEAVTMIKENPNIDLVFMDIKMPVLDGYEALAKIREFNKKIPVVAQTAFAMESDKSKIYESGFDYFISKPILLNNLHEALTRFFKKNV